VVVGEGDELLGDDPPELLAPELELALLGITETEVDTMSIPTGAGAVATASDATAVAAFM